MARPKKIISRLHYPSNLDFSIFPDENTKNRGLFILDKAIFYTLACKGEKFYMPCKELKFLGKGYAKAKDILIDHGVLMTNRFYWYSAHHATEYELAPEYRSAKKWNYAYHTGDKFGEKLAKLKADRLKAKIKENRHAKEVCITQAESQSRSKVYKWVYGTSIEASTLSIEYHVEAQAQKKQAQRKYWEDCGTMIEAEPYEPYISPLSGRMYYLACSFPSKSRKHILLDGKETGEVDICCAQPYFCVSLYDSTNEAHRTEREEYLRFIRDEDYYDGLNLAAGMPYEDRDAAKVAAYTQILFGSVKAMHMPLGKALRERFPLLFWEIYNLKKNHPNPDGIKVRTVTKNGEKMKKGNGNRYFSIKLQKLEADITFSVVEELMKRGILCLTVHDSIRVQAEYVKLVEDLYKRECYKRVGSYPSLKTECPEPQEYVCW